MAAFVYVLGCVGVAVDTVSKVTQDHVTTPQLVQIGADARATTDSTSIDRPDSPPQRIRRHNTYFRREKPLRASSSHPAVLLQREFSASLADKHQLGVDPSGISLLLDFEEGEGTCQDTSGSGFLPESTDGRFVWINAQSDDDCKRGNRCMKFLPNSNRKSFPVKVPCVKLSGSWSVTAWVKSEDPMGQQTVFFYGKSYPDKYQIQCHVMFKEGSILCEGPGITTTTSKSGQGEFAAGFHHLAVTYKSDGDSGGRLLLYWDGMTMAQQASTQKFEKGSANLYLGTLFGFEDEDRDFKGTMDEFTVWQRQLSQSEILSIRDQYASFTGSRLKAAMPRLQLLLDFEDKSANPQDSSGNDLTVLRDDSSTSYETSGCQRGESCIRLKGQSADSGDGMLGIDCLRLQQDWSFSAWLKVDTLTARQNIFFYGTDKAEDDYSFFCSVKYTSGTILCKGSATFGSIESSHFDVEALTWHHFAVTRRADDGTLALFWDGKPQGSEKLKQDAMPVARNFILGRELGTNTSSTQFLGVMDEVTAWSQTLSESDVLSVRGAVEPSS